MADQKTLADELRETAQKKLLEEEQEKEAQKERATKKLAQQMQEEVPPLVAKTLKACLVEVKKDAQQGFFSARVSVFHFNNNQENVNLAARDRNYKIACVAADEVVKLLEEKGLDAQVDCGSHCNDDSGSDYLYVSIGMSWKK